MSTHRKPVGTGSLSHGISSVVARYVNLYLRMYWCTLRVYSGGVYRVATANKLVSVGCVNWSKNDFEAGSVVHLCLMHLA
jgi:hypothetical protein